jgi:predicted flap endonuclease-1-like 5' DNA nuclease
LRRLEKRVRIFLSFFPVLAHDKEITMAKLSEIEGIGESYAARLKEAGLRSVNDLLKSGCESDGRRALADRTGISESLLLDWVNRADLTRIKGVSTQYADLLECAGVDSVPELAQRNPENLQAKMVAINEQGKLVRKVPSIGQVESWVAQAKELPKVVFH